MLHCRTCNKIYFNYPKIVVGRKFIFNDEITIDAEELMENPSGVYKAEDHELYHPKDYESLTFLCPNQEEVTFAHLNVHDTTVYANILAPSFQYLKVTNKNILDLLWLRDLIDDKRTTSINLLKLPTEELIEVNRILKSFKRFKKDD